MWNNVIRTPLLYLYLFTGVAAATAVSFASRNKILLPLLQIVFAYPVMFSLIAQSRRKRAVVAMLFWALCLGVFSVSACALYPRTAAATVIHGTTYAGEMFHWIRTGQGPEGDPLKFVPQHLLHLVLFCVLSLLTGSVLSLFMGAVLMNYMAFYVGSLINQSTDPLLATVMGWHPWSILRVMSFVMLGVILAEPLISRFTRHDYDNREVRPFVWVAIAGLGADIIIKALLAPWWGLKLREILL